MRSSVSCRVVYRSLRKPLNSEPVDLSTTRSLNPETTHTRWSSPRPSTVTPGPRSPSPRRTNEWSWPAPSTSMRSQAYSSTRTSAPVAGRRGVEEVPAERDRVVLGRGDAVLLGVGEGGVLLGVRRQHVGLVAARVRVARSRRAATSRRSGRGSRAGRCRDRCGRPGSPPSRTGWLRARRPSLAPLHPLVSALRKLSTVIRKSVGLPDGAVKTFG